MYNYAKRLIDLVVASIGLIVLSPFLILIILWIKLDSKGPVLFLQKRTGLNGELFTIYKFRSMKIGTPNLATDKLGDPTQYITTSGKFLRKSSLDELPQLINIIKGDMSFVGPRPALYNQYDLIQARKELMIDKIRPGLTGYAQVMGRDFISDDEKVKFDKYYLDNYSVFMDVKIVYLTFIKVVKAENVREN